MRERERVCVCVCERESERERERERESLSKGRRAARGSVVLRVPLSAALSLALSSPLRGLRGR